jgi:hypothetical protein
MRVLVALAILVAGSVSMPAKAAGACQNVRRSYQIFSGFPHFTADGVRTTFMNRDRAEITNDNDGWGSHATAAIWASTSGHTGMETFIEVGIIEGLLGDGIDSLYTANDSDPDPEFGYDDQFWSATPVLNTSYTLTIRQQTANFAATFSYSNGSGQKTWYDHTQPIELFQVGGEQTHQCARQNRTYVSDMEFRRNSDGSTWVNAASGFLDLLTNPSSTPDWGGIAWCDTYTQFRFWINSNTSTGSCS